jgi:hypothetical protein
MTDEAQCEIETRSVTAVAIVGNAHGGYLPDFSVGDTPWNFCDKNSKTHGPWLEPTAENLLRRRRNAMERGTGYVPREGQAHRWERQSWLGAAATSPRLE